MFSKVLVANRGEIALRVIRACKDLGISTVAVCSTADRDSLHVRFADESVCIGPPTASQSYLSPKAIISAAEITGADAIHPGYGFMAENADFAQICMAHEIVWIGPDPKVIQIMGHKSEAKRTMINAGCPVVPGSDGAVKDASEARRLAEEFGLPVMIKAVAGGGGRGMRLVHDINNVETAFEMASAEAEAAFNNGDLYLEKAIINPRHIEIQVMGDGRGGCIHFGERDCSMQRRHQKLIEESPSPAVDTKLREQMGKTAVQAAAAIKYSGAGTMEFLLDQEGNFYFMEMNTRIQVEHPVTEMVTGHDLVKMQLQVALGEPLPKQKEVTVRGHAIEFRINAEDASRGFLPSPGNVAVWNLPGGPGVRVDTHVYQGYSIPPFYDSLIAKLIVYGADREEALKRCRRALSEFIVEGIHTTIPFHLEMLDTEAFRSGQVHTKWVEQYMEQLAKA
ncbi:MAG: acetyl-CoA carboxylase biotin carboxylase subunit [Calditrichaeota bacterium]|nr:acetyl-CoA carboxylase biotin carboxylase subunit [Calditrichota bacterium]MCB9368290.1 acetyl-CoA carboxylase biotin carboxylase subunit [Calditrichota bacterium]